MCPYYNCIRLETIYSQVTRDINWGEPEENATFFSCLRVKFQYEATPHIGHKGNSIYLAYGQNTGKLPDLSISDIHCVFWTYHMN